MAHPACTQSLKTHYDKLLLGFEGFVAQKTPTLAKTVPQYDGSGKPVMEAVAVQDSEEGLESGACLGPPVSLCLHGRGLKCLLAWKCLQGSAAFYFFPSTMLARPRV